MHSTTGNVDIFSASGLLCYFLWLVGGADGRYQLVDTDDYRNDHPHGIQYMMQGTHTTLVHHYNDTLNFIIASEGNSTKKTMVEVSFILLQGPTTPKI